MNYLEKIKRIVKEVEKKYPTGDEFFNEIDKQFKMEENIDLTIDLFNLIENEFGENYNIVISGGYGRHIIDLIEREIINIKGSIIQLSGGITSHKTDMDKIKKVKDPSIVRMVGDPKNKDFLFIDDSYYSGTTEKTIKEWISLKFNSEIVKTFVIYDGNDKSSNNRSSLYRYYDWNVGTKRSYSELTKELSNYKEILSDKEFNDLKTKIRNGDIISIIQLRKSINEINPIDIYTRIRENNNKNNIYTNMLKYNDFINESIMYKLILESNVQFSDNLIDVLKSLNSPVSNAILKLHNKDLNVTQNFIDINPSDPNMITFTQDSKAQKILEEDENTYTIINKSKHLKLDNFKTDQGREENSEIFKLLGVNIEDFNVSQRASNGDEVLVKNKLVSPFNPSKTYLLYEVEGTDKKGVISQEGANKKSNSKVWSSSRNPYRIGRWATSILRLAGENFSNQDIEKFVNDYKSSINILNDAFSKFDIVDGIDIHKWYHHTRYSSQTGTLGQSCMKGVPEKVLELYIYNKKVCKLVILYDDNGKLIDGKYKSNKIVGRALLWTLSDGDMFLDRIYTINDSDVDLFKKYAKNNDWWCKNLQNTYKEFEMVKGEITKPSGILRVNLENSEFDYYPYLDTLSYLNINESFLTNDDDSDYDICLDDTYEEDDFDDDDDDY